MPTTYPPDRFDRLPDGLTRIGAHRAPRQRGHGWVAFAWAALATGVLVGSGVLALTAFSESLNLPIPDAIAGGPSEEPEPSGTAPESAAPVLDPEVPITILNGTLTSGLANTVGDDLVTQGWCGATGPAEPAEGPCVGQSGLGTRAGATEVEAEVESTVVYYNAPDREAAARALVDSLGVGAVLLSDVYGDSPVTVVIGADYVPPAG